MHLGCTLGVGLGCTGVLECILRVHFGVQDGFRVNWSALGCRGAWVQLEFLVYFGVHFGYILGWHLG